MEIDTCATKPGQTPGLSGLLVLYLSRILQAPRWDPQNVCEGTCETKDIHTVMNSDSQY